MDVAHGNSHSSRKASNLPRAPTRRKKKKQAQSRDGWICNSRQLGSNIVCVKSRLFGNTKLVSASLSLYVFLLLLIVRPSIYSLVFHFCFHERSAKCERKPVWLVPTAYVCYLRWNMLSLWWTSHFFSARVALSLLSALSTEQFHAKSLALCVSVSTIAGY
jgi:hypothetical protein